MGFSDLPRQHVPPTYSIAARVLPLKPSHTHKSMAVRVALRIGKPLCQVGMDLHYGNKSCTVVCMSSRNHVSQQHRFAALSDLPTGCGAADITTCYHIAFGTFSLVYLKETVSEFWISFRALPAKKSYQ